LASLEQTKTNLSRLRTEVDGAEGALQSAVKLFDEVRTLGMTGASGIQTDLTRQTIADQLGSILERMVGLANTQVDGRYIFSGNTDQGAAYELDWTGTPPWGVYQGTAANRQATHPTGVTFEVAKDAREIFDNADPRYSVFASIETLRLSILSGDDAAMKAALAPLGDAGAQLNAMLSFYGNGQNRIAEAVRTSERLTLEWRTQLSQLEDADATEAIVTMQQLNYQREAALQSKAAAPRRSLFDYLG
jgi:flagellar hook-associated protein 3 FlgL